MRISPNFSKPWPAPTPPRSSATDAALRRTRERSRRNAGAVRPPVDLEATYRARLLRSIDEMNKSVRYWLTARFRQTEDHRELLAPGMAFDTTAADDLQRAVRNLRRRWDRHFRELADDLADYFTKKAADRSDADLKRLLRRSGMSVEFKLTSPMREALGAIVNENVSLIRSIPEAYLGKIEGAVMRSVVSGRDLKQLTDDILATYRVTRRRAETIARDQNSKASGALQRVRYQELGIQKAVWMHSHAGRDPRRSHVANDGKEYDVETGWYDPDEKQWIYPGQLIGCRCLARPVIE